MAKSIDILNDSEINRLITCDKILKSAPPKFPHSSNRNIKKTFSVFSADDDEEFSVFFARGMMEFDFSLGLQYLAVPEQPLLYRCNGFHGKTRSGFYSTPHHALVHSHTLSEKDISEKRFRKPTTITDLSGEYYDLGSAIHFFCKKCGILGYEKYFSELSQFTLW